MDQKRMCMDRKSSKVTLSWQDGKVIVIKGTMTFKANKIAYALILYLSPRYTNRITPSLSPDYSITLTRICAYRDISLCISSASKSFARKDICRE